jgi:hypothetical protein
VGEDDCYQNRAWNISSIQSMVARIGAISPDIIIALATVSFQLSGPSGNQSLVEFVPAAKYSPKYLASDGPK